MMLMPLRELSRFVRAPGLPMPAFESRGRAFGFYAHLLSLTLVLQLGVIVLAAGIKDGAGVEFRGFGAHGWVLAITLIGVVPVLEELIFRSWLTRSGFLLAIAVLCAVRLLMPFLSLLVAIQVAAYVVVGLALIVRKERFRRFVAAADEVLARWLPATVPLSTGVFALIHVPNWDLPPGALWLVPLVVLPQFISGLMLAYARVRSGLKVSIVLHAAINTLAVLAIGAGH